MFLPKAAVHFQFLQWGISGQRRIQGGVTFERHKIQERIFKNSTVHTILTILFESRFCLSSVYIINYDNFRLKMLNVKSVFLFRQFFSSRATRQLIPRTKTHKDFFLIYIN